MWGRVGGGGGAAAADTRADTRCARRCVFGGRLVPRCTCECEGRVQRERTWRAPHTSAEPHGCPGGGGGGSFALGYWRARDARRWVCIPDCISGCGDPSGLFCDRRRTALDACSGQRLSRARLSQRTLREPSAISLRTMERLRGGALAPLRTALRDTAGRRRSWCG